MKKTTVRIGEAIYKILEPFDKVYAIIADEGTTFPFITYKRTSGYSQSDKDGKYSVLAHIDVTVAAQNYEDSVMMAEQVIKTMESARGKIAGFDIWEIIMVESSESYREKAFIQELRFSVEFSTK